MKKYIINFFTILVILSIIISCTTPPQQKRMIDIFYFKSINNQTEDFKNHLIQILEPFQLSNDSLIIVPEGKLYYTTDKGLVSIDLVLKDNIWSTIQKKGSFQTFDMIVKQAKSTNENLNVNFLKASDALSYSEIIAGLNKVLKTNTYQNKFAYPQTNSSTSWNNIKVIHDLQTLKSIIRESFNINPTNTILIIYNPLSETSDKQYSEIDAYISLPEEKTLHEELLKIIDTKRSREEREKIAQIVWDEYFSPDVYVENFDDPDHLKNPQYWSPGNGQSYFMHLVTLPSIIDVNILAVERDKETQKISGFKVCEIHNGSKFIEN